MQLQFQTSPLRRKPFHIVFCEISVKDAAGGQGSHVGVLTLCPHVDSSVAHSTMQYSQST